jgi:hypothetical protein
MREVLYFVVCSVRGRTVRCKHWLTNHQYCRYAEPTIAITYRRALSNIACKLEDMNLIKEFSSDQCLNG